MTALLSPYEILNIRPEASIEEIQHAYHRLKSTYGRNQPALYSLIAAEDCALALSEIEEAYRILSDSQSRRQIREKGEDAYSRGFNAALPDSPFFELSADDALLQSPETSIDQTLAELSLPERHRLGYTPKQPRKASLRDPKRLDALPNPPPEVPLTGGGMELKKVRLGQGISLEELSAMTKIRRTYLIALEEECFGELPASVYVRGFLLQVARALKLPGTAVTGLYLEKMRAVRHE